MSRKLCLLIVDDDKDLLDPVIEVCERFAFNVIGACSGEKALEIVAKTRVDAILTDVRMQPMGGFKLLETVRALYPEMPFILWTGFWDRPDEKKASQFENIERLEKPFTFRELEQVLNRIRAKVLARGEEEDGDGDGDGAAGGKSSDGGAVGVGGIAGAGSDPSEHSTREHVRDRL